MLRSREIWRLGIGYSFGCSGRFRGDVGKIIGVARKE